MTSEEIIEKVEEDDTQPEEGKQEEKAKVFAFDKKLKGLLEVASKEASRYALHGVYVEKEGNAVATDGRVLLKVPLVEVDADGVPAGLDVEPLTEDVWLSRDLLTKMLSGLPTGCLPVCNYAFIKKQGEKVSLVHTDLDTVTEFSQKDEQMEYPDCNEIIDGEKKTVFRISFMAKVLEQMIKAAKQIGGKDVILTFSFSASDSASDNGAFVRFQTENGEALAVVMPCRGD